MNMRAPCIARTHKATPSVLVARALDGYSADSYLVTNPHVSQIHSPIAAIVNLISVVVPVVANSHAP
jgi:hypothetical protein